MIITIPDENVVEVLANFERIMNILFEYSYLKNYDVICEASILGTYTKEIEEYYDSKIKPNSHSKSTPDIESF